MRIPDFNDASLVYVLRGHQHKRRINTALSGYEGDTYIAGYVSAEKIPSDTLGANVLLILTSTRPALNQPYSSCLQYLLRNDQTIQSMYTTPYNGSDSLKDVYESGVIDHEILSYHLLRGYRPVFNEVRFFKNQIIRIITD